MKNLLLIFILSLCNIVSGKGLEKNWNQFTNNSLIATGAVIIDRERGLMWKKCSEGQKSNDCRGKAKKYTWFQAVRHAKKEVFLNYNDWRLPTQSELRSLRYCSNGEGVSSTSCSQDYDSNFNKIINFEVPTIRTKFFPNTSSDGWYWSSTNDAIRSFGSNKVYETVVCVTFEDGYYPSNSKHKHGYVRLVRNIKPNNSVHNLRPDSILPEDNRLELSKNIILDPIMNIMWKKCTEGQKGSKCKGKGHRFTWNKAVQYARNHSYYGYNDWRLPTDTEIRTLRFCSNRSEKESLNCGLVSGKENKNYQSPTIQKNLFPNTQKDFPYWTSSIFSYYDLQKSKRIYYKRIAKVFGFNDGSYFLQSKSTNRGYLRLVRTP